jgi:hypothetical protein
MKDEPVSEPRKRRWLLLLINVLVAFLVVVVLALWGGTQAIKQGLVSGPTFTLKFGTYHIIAQTTNRPECVPLPLQECLVTFPMPNKVLPTYTIWAGHMMSERTLIAEGAYTVSRGRLVFALVLD